MKQHRIQQLQIEALNSKGNGIAHDSTATAENQRKIEVPFAIPGDYVQVLRTKRRYGKLDEVLRPSKDRINPRCVHFGVCGGCRWQQMSYESQLAYKQAVVQNAFSPFFSGAILPILSASSAWQYRNKMEYTFSMDAAGQRYLGLLMEGARGKVLNLKECYLVSPWFTQTLVVVRDWWAQQELMAYYPPRNSGSLRTLTLREGRRTGERMVVLTVSGNPEYAVKRHQLDHFVACIRAALEGTAELSIILRIQQAIEGHPTTFYDMVLHGPDCIQEELYIQPKTFKERKTLRFMISPSSFFQPNTDQAEKIYSLALDMADVGGQTTVLDLYCGTGTIGISLAPYVKKVIGIELSSDACLDARENAKLNGVEDKVEILNGDVGLILSQRFSAAEGKNSNDPIELVIVDPPRTGLDQKVLHVLRGLKCEKLIYISCNPLTQAENIEWLCREGGYVIEQIQPVDQFPQTYHMENIVLLRKAPCPI